MFSKRLEELFHTARALDDAAREAFLLAEIPDDEPLRRELKTLLRAERESESFLAEPVAVDRASDGPVDAPAELRAGDRIGNYVLLERIGVGGVGEVWLADQTAPMSRRVAIKVIRQVANRRHVVARFESERQTLARMEHSNIARVFDAGVTASGRPYFVMEYVEGMPITKWCETKNVRLRQRILLFRQVCQTVQHAHTRAIVHRDLKPSNVLVNTIDSTPAVKVIDFGIAKAIHDQPIGDALMTHEGQFIGTPAYVSPEQAAGSPGVDTRSDIYSLGILLYELMTGATPLDQKRLEESSYADLPRIIRETEPTRPSTVLAERLAKRTAEGTIDPADATVLFTSVLRGDIDWVVLRAIERNPDDRYQTAAEFIEDIDAFLDDRPVRARSGSRLYRAMKFWRRHRVSLAAASLVTAAVIAGAVGTGFGLVRERRANAALDVALHESQRRADELEVVASFQARQLTRVDPADLGVKLRQLIDESPSNMTTVAQRMLEENFFDPTLEEIETSFADQPLVKARLLRAAAVTMLELGLLDGALPPIKRAIELIDQHSSADDPIRVKARLERANLLNERGDFKEAEADYRAALDQSDRLDEREVINARVALGGLLRDTGRFDEAEPIVVDAHASAIKTFGEDDPASLVALNGLAMLRSQQGRWEEAGQLYRRTLERREKVLGPNHPDTLKSLTNMGIISFRVNRPDDSERYTLEALARSRRIHGDNHPQTLLFLGNAAGMFTSRMKLGEAEKCYREAVALSEKVHGPDGYDTLQLLDGLAELRYRQGGVAEAETLYRRAAETLRAIQGVNHPRTAMNHNSLGILLMETDRPGEAIEPLRVALEGRTALFGTDGPAAWQTHDTSILLGEALVAHAETQLETDPEVARKLLAEARERIVPSAKWLVERADDLPDPDLPAIAARAAARLFETLHQLDPAAGHAAEAERWRK